MRHFRIPSIFKLYMAIYFFLLFFLLLPDTLIAQMTDTTGPRRRTGPVELVIIIVLSLIVLIVIRYLKTKKKKLNNNNGDIKLDDTLTTRNPTNKNIFINYRKEDSSGYALALYNELLKWYEKKTIFKDFHNINPGEDFEEAIEKALSSCNILLVIISDRWIEILTERHKKMNQQDFVSLEIATALLKNIYTVPITINGASMPDPSELPDDLKKLSRRQSLDIHQTWFESDILKLVDIIDKRLDIQRNV